MKIIEFLKDTTLPPEVLNTNIVALPNKNFKGNVFHFAASCREIKDAAERQFYAILDDCLEHDDYSNFTAFSLKFILDNSDKMCSTCFKHATLFGATGFIDSLLELTSILKRIEKFVSLETCSLVAGFNLLEDVLFLNDVPGAKTLKEVLENVIFAKMRSSKSSYPTTTTGLTNFHSKLVKVINESVVSKSRLLKNDPSFVLEQQFFKENLRLLKENKQKVLCSMAHLDLENLVFAMSEDHGELFKKLLLKPGFNRQGCIILPYVEFKFLSTFFVNFKDTETVFLDEIPSSDVMENFVGLLDKNNATLSNYESLLEIASSL